MIGIQTIMRHVDDDCMYADTKLCIYVLYIGTLCKGLSISSTVVSIGTYLTLSIMSVATFEVQYY